MTELTSKDGHFSCTPDHAVEVAHLMSIAEAVILYAQDSSMVGFMVYEWLAGNLTNDELREWLDEELEKAWNAYLIR